MEEESRRGVGLLRLIKLKCNDPWGTSLLSFFSSFISYSCFIFFLFSDASSHKWVRPSFNPSVCFSIPPFIRLSDCPSVPPSICMLVRYTCAQIVQVTHWVAWMNSIIPFSLLWKDLSVVWLVGSSVDNSWVENCQKRSKALRGILHQLFHSSLTSILFIIIFVIVTLNQICEITYFFRNKSNCIIWLSETYRRNKIFYFWSKVSLES